MNKNNLRCLEFLPSGDGGTNIDVERNADIRGWFSVYMEPRSLKYEGR